MNVRIPKVDFLDMMRLTIIPRSKSQTIADEFPMNRGFGWGFESEPDLA